MGRHCGREEAAQKGSGVLLVVQPAEAQQLVPVKGAVGHGLSFQDPVLQGTAAELAGALEQSQTERFAKDEAARAAARTLVEMHDDVAVEAAQAAAAAAAEKRRAIWIMRKVTMMKMKRAGVKTKKPSGKSKAQNGGNAR